MTAPAPVPGVAATEATTVRVDLGARSYDVVVGAGLIGRAGALLRPALAQPRVAIVTDETVAALYLAALEASLSEAGIAHASVVVPAGEATKSFAQLERLCEALLERRVERRTTIVALGGGVVGDLAGFAAGVLLRGLDVAQIPTTLLAQVDSSVGGKTGVNTRAGKNLVGLFHQPRLVLADSSALATLDPRQLRAGYAEVVKYGLIDDAPLFAWLEAEGAAALRCESGAVEAAVVASVRAKARVVAADEREAGSRALLNLGHTFGHALEAAAGFSDLLLHGEAVAIGMRLAFDLSVQLGLCPPADAARVERHLAAAGLPTGLGVLAGKGIDAAALVELMQSDKKVRDGRLTFILARGIGSAFIAHDVPLDPVRRLLADAIAASV